MPGFSARITQVFRLNQLSLNQKLITIILVPTLLVLLIAGSILFLFDYYLLNRYLEDELELSSRFAAHSLVEVLQVSDDTELKLLAEDALNVLRRNEHILAAAVYTYKPIPVAQYQRDDGMHISVPIRPESGDREFFTRSDGSQIHAFLTIYSPRAKLGTLYILADRSFLAQRVGIFMILVGTLMIGCGLLAYYLSSRLQNIISRPILELANVAKTVSHNQEYSIRALKMSEDEIGRLVDEFNNMLDQIEDRDQRLLEAQEQLEERVYERTKELRRETEEHKDTAGALTKEVLERKKIEVELQKALKAAEAANLSKDEFLANMSHEIRTPMNGIIGMTELLINSNLTPLQEKYAYTIRRSGEALLKIIGDILDYSKVEAGEVVIDPIPFNLRVACEDVVELFSGRAEEKGIQLLLRFAPDCPRMIVGDAGRIRQILTNLVSNAIKFTEDGHVLLNVDCTGVLDGAVSLVVSVEDTGIGLPSDKLEDIFNKYTQGDMSISRKYGGTGLGLAISKQLVHLMGGMIGVGSQVGKGSRFFFTLRLPLDPAHLDSTRLVEGLRGLRLLVVDNNRLRRHILREQIRSWGMEVHLAATSMDAMRMLEAAHETNAHFQITLIDDQMPGIRGESIARAIKRNPNISATLLVLMTSFDQHSDTQQLQEIGYSAYLTHPIRQSELMDTLVTIWHAHAKGEDIGLVSVEHVQRRDETAAAPIAKPRKIKAKVLVAEDNMVNQQVAYEILTQFGCDVALVDDGQAAVDAARSQHFDVIFMDCQMPVIDGYTATEKIRRAEAGGRRVPIVAMTAHAMKGDREKCIAAGMDDYVNKPVDSKVLFATLERWVQKAPIPTAPATETKAGTPSIKLPKSRAELRLAREEQMVKARGNGGTAGDLVLDMQQALWVTGGKLAMFRRVADVFLQHMPTRMEELAAALAAKDIKEVTRLAHSIKGASASVGGMRVKEGAFKLENLGHAENLEGSAEVFAALLEEFEALKSALENVDWDNMEAQQESKS